MTPTVLVLDLHDGGSWLSNKQSALWIFLPTDWCIHECCFQMEKWAFWGNLSWESIQKWTNLFCSLFKTGILHTLKYQLNCQLFRSADCKTKHGLPPGVDAHHPPKQQVCTLYCINGSRTSQGMCKDLKTMIWCPMQWSQWDRCRDQFRPWRPYRTQLWPIKPWTKEPFWCPVVSGTRAGGSLSLDGFEVICAFWDCRLQEGFY